ncbi:hypothetical protein CSAL01_07148 [Colletotrichum salicis]|uniref:Uncharacterized protein n=1 Tax=Colletotrichum salicis TaxID=1209931 RepID=A0A135TJI5_9PEZI|nr:hypothetical protein CSAL01_07148 [Colletotrichum salicis]
MVLVAQNWAEMSQMQQRFSAEWESGVQMHKQMQCDSRLTLEVASAGQSVTNFSPAYNRQPEEGVLELGCAGPSFPPPPTSASVPSAGAASCPSFLKFPTPPRLPRLRREDWQCVIPFSPQKMRAVCLSIGTLDVFFDDKDSKEKMIDVRPNEDIWAP